MKKRLVSFFILPPCMRIVQGSDGNCKRGRGGRGRKGTTEDTESAERREGTVEC
jgi:hypothetical protein